MLQVAISAGLLFLIFRSLKWGDVQDALLRIDFRWLLAGFVLFVLGVVVRAGRWQVLLNALGVRRSLGDLTSWYLVGSFFNVILPTGFGGDAVRVAELGADTRRLGPVLNSVLVDRYMGIMVLLPMGLLAGALKPGVASWQVLAVTGVLFAGGLVAAVLLPRRFWSDWARRQDLLGSVVRRLRLDAMADSLAAYDAATIVRALVISLVFNFMQIGWNVALANGLGLHLPLLSFLLFVPLTAVALLLPSFGGLGVRELTYRGLFGTVGVPAALATALSFSVYIITVATGLLGGVLYLSRGLRGAAARSVKG